MVLLMSNHTSNMYNGICVNKDLRFKELYYKCVYHISDT